MATKKSNSVSVSNRKAHHNYIILEKLNAGLVLKGFEVKSIRQGKVSLNEAYVRIDKGEAWLLNCHIAPYPQGPKHETIDPRRTRKLLLKKAEISKLYGKVMEKGLTLMPIKLYFSNHNVKITIGLAKSKKLHDKRQQLKEKDIKRAIEQKVRR